MGYLKLQLHLLYIICSNMKCSEKYFHWKQYNFGLSPSPLQIWAFENKQWLAYISSCFHSSSNARRLPWQNTYCTELNFWNVFAQLSSPVIQSDHSVLRMRCEVSFSEAKMSGRTFWDTAEDYCIKNYTLSSLASRQQYFQQIIEQAALQKVPSDQIIRKHLYGMNHHLYRLIATSRCIYFLAVSPESMDFSDLSKSFRWIARPNKSVN